MRDVLLIGVAIVVLTVCGASARTWYIDRYGTGDAGRVKICV